MVRFDRLLTLSIFYPLSRLKIMPGTSGIPILMYHSVSNDIQPGLHPYYQTSTSRQTFAAHLKFLSDHQYAVVPLREAVTRFQNRGCSKERAVAITFDDGFADFYNEAFPILQAYGFPCTVFLPVAFVDGDDMSFKSKKCLSWDQVRELKRHGVTFGSHTMTHPQLAGLTEQAVKDELERSKNRIENELQESVESFSYPFAFPQEDSAFINRLKTFLEDAGYSYGVTTKIGIADVNDDRFFLRRIPVNDCDDITLFKAKLAGAYNWVSGFQKGYRIFRSKVIGRLPHQAA